MDRQDDLFKELLLKPDNQTIEDTGIASDVDNWNFRFQDIISLPEETREEKLHKYSLLNGLNRDFIGTASLYAKTIISEYFLEDHLKSINFEQMGGCAGGKKFQWRGIMFKLARGDLGPYGGNDEAAAKAMGNELKGGNSYFRCFSATSDIHVALQALIDYKGFRMHAQAILPIDDSTMMVGTSDGSQNVFANSPAIIDALRLAAEELNLKEHVVREKMMYSACDVEGHEGHDGKRYIVDLARAFPPEAPDNTPHISPQLAPIEVGSMVHFRHPNHGVVIEGLVVEKPVGGLLSVYPSSTLAAMTAATMELQSEISDMNCDEPLAATSSSLDESACMPQPLTIAVSDICNQDGSIRDNEMSIFWRLLRPEFVKNRGRQLLGEDVLQAYNPQDMDVGAGLLEMTMTAENLGVGECPPGALNRSISGVSSLSSSSGYCTAGYMTNRDKWEDNIPFGASLPNTAGFVKESLSYLQVSQLSCPQYALDALPGHGGYSFGSAMRPSLSSAPTAPDARVPSIPARDDSTSSKSNRSQIRTTQNKKSLPPLWKLERETSVMPCLPPVPLSPDALSAFNDPGPFTESCDHDVRRATELLVKELIPAMAQDLMRNGHPLHREGHNITEYMHRHGVNIRHAGLLRSKINELSRDKDKAEDSGLNAAKSELLLECVLRTLKNTLRRMQRQWMYTNASTSEDGMIKVVVKFLNLITCAHPKSDVFWSSVAIPGMFKRFGSVVLTVEEAKLCSPNGRALILELLSDEDVHLLLKCICSRAGIVLHSDCLEHLENGNAKCFEFAVSDVVDMIPVVKHMHQVDLGEGIMLSLQCQLSEKSETVNQNVRFRLLTLAVNKLHKALKAVPDDKTTKQALADAYQALAFMSISDKSTAGLKSHENIIDRGFELYRSLLRADEHTKCAKQNISFEKDILGVCLFITHKGYDRSGKKRSKSMEDFLQADSCPIRDVYVHPECVSLTYFRKLASAYSTQDSVNVPETEKILCWRFFPLIVDPSHAQRAKAILAHEVLLADKVTNKEYRHDHILSIMNCSINTSKEPFELCNIYDTFPSFFLRVVSAVINSVVLVFLNDADATGRMPDEALCAFIRFHHMLLFKAREDPSIRREANETIERFVKDKTYRTKEGVPDLGRLLVYLLLSDRGWDDEFRYIYVEETLNRQVHWFIKKREFSLLVLEDDEVSAFRLQKTFELTVGISLRLVMFQVYFLHSIARSGVAQKSSSASHSSTDVVLHLYNASLGRPTAAMRNDYQAEFKEIMAVSNYGQFLARVGCFIPPRLMTSLLRNAIRTSKGKKYGNIHEKDILGSHQMESICFEGLKDARKRSECLNQWNHLNENALSNESLRAARANLYRRWKSEAKSPRDRDQQAAQAREGKSAPHHGESRAWTQPRHHMNEGRPPSSRPSRQDFPQYSQKRAPRRPSQLNDEQSGAVAWKSINQHKKKR